MAATSPADTVEPCGPTWTALPPVDAGESTELEAAHGVSGEDVWGVGVHSNPNADRAGIIVRWTGGSSAGRAGGMYPVDRTLFPKVSSELHDVVALSDRDAWAVGTVDDPFEPARPARLRWDGRRWSEVRQTTALGELNGISALGPSDIWSVGTQGLIEHWDGASWSLVPGGGDDPTRHSFEDVDAVAADDVWAVGGHYDPARGVTETLIQHWDGRRWGVVAPPDGAQVGSLEAVEAVASNDVWAAGGVWDGSESEPILIHWDGAAWTRVVVPVGDARLEGLAARSAGDVWAVGSRQEGFSGRQLVLHWDGRGWSVVDVRNIGQETNRFVDATVIGGAEVWAVGSFSILGGPFSDFGLARRLCPIAATGRGFLPANVRVERGAPVAWSFVGRGRHSVSDPSGMGLFESGIRRGGSLVHAFPVAATYEVADRATGARGTVEVPLSARPTAAAPGSRVTLALATRTPPEGFVIDVQIRRPGESRFRDWRMGLVDIGVEFRAPRDTGVHAFRSRIRHPGRRAASKWSPVERLEVLAPSEPCTGAWDVMPSPDGSAYVNSLAAVAALSGTDVWAVGTHGRSSERSGTLVLHWDGVSWGIVPSPAPGERSSLSGIAVVTRDDIWAVGSQDGTTTLTMHWDGRRWAIVPAPFGGALADVVAVGARDVWAVGSAYSEGSWRPFFLHWDGTAWSFVPAAEGPADARLTGLAGVDGTEVWAVGTAYGGSSPRPLIERWDGERWQIARVAGPEDVWLSNVDGTGQDDLWAVGGRGGLDELPLLLHWDGSSWTEVPGPGVRGVSLWDVSAISGTDAWAVGWHPEHGGVSMQWNGERWFMVPTPDPEQGRAGLTGVSAPAHGHVWAVGDASLDEVRSRTVVAHRCPTSGGGVAG